MKGDKFVLSFVILGGFEMTSYVYPNTLEEALHKLAASGLKGTLINEETYANITIPESNDMKRKDWEGVFEQLCAFEDELKVKDILLTNLFLKLLN